MSGLQAPAQFTTDALDVSGNAIASSAASKGYDSAGALVVGAGPVTSWSNGLPFNAAGAVVVVDKAAAVAPFSYLNGLQIDANGAVVTTSIAAATLPLSLSSGLNFDATGALVAE